MVVCKKCGHEQYSHIGGYGKCCVVLIEKEGQSYEVSLGAGIKAWTQDIEYGEECPCPVMITWMPSSSTATGVRHTYDEKKGSLHEYGFG